MALHSVTAYRGLQPLRVLPLRLGLKHHYRIGFWLQAEGLLHPGFGFRPEGLLHPGLVHRPVDSGWVPSGHARPAALQAAGSQ